MIILASKSPRRKELLSLMGIKDFKVVVADIIETIDGKLSPPKIVENLSYQKACAVSNLCCKNDIIIGADTLVFFNNTVLGKPSSPDDAVRMLSLLSNGWHKVISGICVINHDRIIVDHEITEVKFKQLSNSEIQNYVATGEPLDKAGAYGIQGLASLFVERINGDFYNVMGLPICKLGEMLKKQGVGILWNNIWKKMELRFQ